MNRMLATALAIVFVLSMACAAYAGEVTIDGNVKVTVLGGGFYQIDYSGTLKLKDIGGGYEQWAYVTLFVKNGTKEHQMGTASLTPPTLMADGSYAAQGSVVENKCDTNWLAYAQITFFTAAMKTDSKVVAKAFTVP